MFEKLNNEFSKNQKIEFIRSAQSIFWTMTPYEILRGMTDEELDSYFKFIYDHSVPAELMDRVIGMAKEIN